jgi:hypothetical protein
MMGGGGQGGGMGQPGEQTDGFGGGFGGPGGDMPDRETMQQAMQMIQDAGGELTDAVKAALAELGLTEEQMTMFTEMGGGGFPGRAMGENPNAPQGEGEAPGVMPENTGTAEQSSFSVEAAIIIGIVLLVLVGATVFIARKRKNVI